MGWRNVLKVAGGIVPNLIAGQTPGIMNGSILGWGIDSILNRHKPIPPTVTPTQNPALSATAQARGDFATQPAQPDNTAQGAEGKRLLGDVDRIARERNKQSAKDQPKYTPMPIETPQARPMSQLPVSSEMIQVNPTTMGNTNFKSFYKKPGGFGA